MRKPVRQIIRRNNLILQSVNLPVIMNLNPRSVYNKGDELSLLIEQYSADVICISESWERENLPLEQFLQLDNFEIIKLAKMEFFLIY